MARSAETTPVTTYLDPDENEKLKELANNLKTSKAEVLREGINSLIVDNLKERVPGQADSIDEFAKHYTIMMDLYRTAILLGADAKEKVREEFREQLRGMETLADECESLRSDNKILQEEVDCLKSNVSELEQKLLISSEENCRINDKLSDKEAVTEENIMLRKEVNRLNEERVSMREKHLSDLQEKDATIEKISEKISALTKDRDSIDQARKNDQREFEFAFKEAEKNAERNQEKAVREVSTLLQEKINGLLDQLREEKNKSENYKREAETSKLAAVAEMHEAYSKEVESQNKRYEELNTRYLIKCDELMQLKDEISTIRLELQSVKTKDKP